MVAKKAILRFNGNTHTNMKRFERTFVNVVGQQLNIYLDTNASIYGAGNDEDWDKIVCSQMIRTEADENGEIVAIIDIIDLIDFCDVFLIELKNEIPSVENLVKTVGTTLRRFDQKIIFEIDDRRIHYCTGKHLVRSDEERDYILRAARELLEPNEANED